MNIFITHAGGSIGAALALEYAAKGNTLLLVDSDPEQLFKVAEACKLRGARVVQKSCDHKSYLALGSWIEHCDDEDPIDMVMINSDIVPFHRVREGISQDKLEDWEQVKHVLDINLQGVIYVMLTVVALMKKRGSGTVMLLNSFASKVHVPGFASYSASKAAVRFYVNSIRHDLADMGISVFMAYLNHIKDHNSGKSLLSLPGMVKPGQVASRIKNALIAGKQEFYVNVGSRALTYIFRVLPDCLLLPLLKMFRS